MLSTRLKIGYIAFSVLIATTCVGFYFFRNLDAWLKVSDPVPESLDVLFTLSGEDTRLAYSKVLFAKHPRNFWLISNPNGKLLRKFVKESLDTLRMHVIDTCANTRSEIAFLKNWIGQSLSGKFPKQMSRQDTGGLLKIGIVSNWYHMRRIKMIVSAQIPKAHFSFYYLPVPHEYEKYWDKRKPWWRQKIARNIAFIEWKKSVYYLLLHPKLLFSKDGLY